MPLERAIDLHGAYPSWIAVDNEPEFTSRAMLRWAASHDIELQHIAPGKPIQNAFIESFNGKLRDDASTSMPSRRSKKPAERSSPGIMNTTSCIRTQLSTTERPRVRPCGAHPNASGLPIMTGIRTGTTSDPLA